MVVFLASDDASYMTGEIVHVDAGYTLLLADRRHRVGPPAPLSL